MKLPYKTKMIQAVLQLPAMVGFAAIILMSVVFAFGNEGLAKSLGVIAYLSFLVAIATAFVERFFFQRLGIIKESE